MPWIWHETKTEKVPLAGSAGDGASRVLRCQFPRCDLDVHAVVGGADGLPEQPLQLFLGEMGEMGEFLVVFDTFYFSIS